MPGNNNENKQEQQPRRPRRKPHSGHKRQADWLNEPTGAEFPDTESGSAAKRTENQRKPAPKKPAPQPQQQKKAAAPKQSQKQQPANKQQPQKPAPKRENTDNDEKRQQGRRPAQNSQPPRNKQWRNQENPALSLDFSDITLTPRQKKPVRFEEPEPEIPSSYPPGSEVLEDIPRISYAVANRQENASEEKVCIIGVQFKTAGKVYYFDPGELQYAEGDRVIVETTHGLEFGTVAIENRMIVRSENAKALRPVIRKATLEDIAHDQENRQKESEAFRICAEKIKAHKLDMKLVDAQYTFDNAKLLFYFTADGRVDFRDLVKDLAGVFRIRIELRQIGIRDESRMMGGLGACGRPLCCASFLNDFVQVSIKMAKEQNLSLNSNKISGCCGRLMCCLHYEYETYQAELRLMPAVDSKVMTPDGPATVCELSPVPGTIKVRFDDKDTPSKTYYKKDITPIVPEKKNESPDPKAAKESE